MNILSIQSQVTYGHVGNSAAVFPLQRLGAEVWPVNTVEFSNHPGYGAFRGCFADPSVVADLLRGIAERGVLGSCDGVLSGYLGAPATGEAVLDAVGAVKKANPKALYCCDPVIGDRSGGAYVRPGVGEFFRDRALGAADLVTPNHFELEYLSGRAVRTRLDLREALAAIAAEGPRVVMVTTLELEDMPSNMVELAVFAEGETGLLRTPRLSIEVNGAGDMIAGLFFFHFLRDKDPRLALAKAAASTFGVLARTAAAGSRELLLVDAQEEFVQPSNHFAVEPL